MHIICCYSSGAALLLSCRSVCTELFIAFCRSHVPKWILANAPPATQNQFFLSQLWFLIFTSSEEDHLQKAREKVRKERANQLTHQQLIKVLWSSVICMKLNSAQLYQQSSFFCWKWMTSEHFVTLWWLILIEGCREAFHRLMKKIPKQDLSWTTVQTRMC